MSNTQRKKIDSAKKKLKKYITSLQNDGFSVKNAYLYGSYARGDFRINSDIDICIISDKFKKNWDANERYLWRKAWRIDPKIEPIGYSPKEFKQDLIPLVSEIKKTGIRIV